ncbi:unnamed protein product [Allacma fusca]|uniref:Uncharacterized protein n=1 Tax=Allacma fusca TaxID=39272 RepID=A0A8J2KKI7_9HEXA|nr:unnamed protein product [Allacma fusca]
MPVAHLNFQIGPTGNASNNQSSHVSSTVNTPKPGVWAPGSKNNSPVSSPSNVRRGDNLINVRKTSKGDEVDSSALPHLQEPIVPIWTPPSAASPSTQKKFRPVNFNAQTSPTGSPRIVSLERSLSAGHVGEQKLSLAGGSSGRNFVSSTPDHKEESKDLSRVEGGGSIHQNHNLHQSQSSQSVHLPKYQSPTVTLLQKAREGHLPKGALYLDHKNPGVQRSSSASGGFNSLLPQQHPVVAGPSSSSQQPSSLNPNDTLYELKKEDYKTTPTGATRRAEFTPRKYDGVGPTTPEGVPIALKSGITSNGHEWYRRMYESLHVDKPHRKVTGLRSPYGGPTGGSWSEPEGYESDTYAYKYATLDRRKLRDRYVPDTEYLSPGPGTPTSIPGSIRFTPGRIEDYTPGNSSVAAKEIRRHKPTLQWALGSKDLGYESDSNLVIRKRQEAQDIPPPPPLSPAEQRQVYVEIQKGGEVPLHGLRKPAPEKPKAMSPMPSFEEVKRSLASRPRSGSPSSFRSGSPSMLKSPQSTVALIQERIQAKLRRANSDINPAKLHGRSRSSPGNSAASRLIHSVRSVSHVRGALPASFIPIRSRNTSMEKLRVSSPELTSPREVKKAMETSHKLSIKLEVVEPAPASSSKSNGSRKTKHTESSEKKSGMKKSGTSSKTGKKAKSVKIAENGATTINDKISSNGHSPVPAKPPRKLHGKSSEGKVESTPGGKVHKTVKATPVATRHAGCLSPHHSRPTSPGGSAGLSLAPAASSSNSMNIPIPPKIPPGMLVKSSAGLGSGGGGKSEKRKSGSLGSTGGGGTIVAATAGGMSSVTSGSSSQPGSSGTITTTTTTTRGSASLTLTSGISTSGRSGGMSSRSHRSPGDGLSQEKDNKGNRISRSTSSKVCSSVVQLTATISASESGTTHNKGKWTRMEVEERRATKRAREEEGSKSCERKDGGRMEGRKNERKREEMMMEEASSLFLPLSLPLTSTLPSSPFLTIPPRKGKDFLTEVWTLEEEHDSCTSRSCTPNFRSLPALTPYLRETKRVTGSMFVTKTNHAAMLREKAALAKRLGLDEASSSTNTGSKFHKAKGNKKLKSRSSSAGSRQDSVVPLGAGPDSEASHNKGRNNGVFRSASCLGLRRSRDYTYAKYILELQHSRKKSPRFVQLHRLYSSLERLGQLERSTSMYDIPILSLERQLDFDAWWKVRNRTRVDEEIASISSQLSTAQRNREFFFRPRRVEEFKWKGDSALRCKQWSINELRSFLMGEEEKRHSKSASDLHKTAWRGTSVKEVALTMEVNALSKSGLTFAESNRIFGGPWLRRAFSMSSTLSEDQRENIKKRLGTLISPERLKSKKEREGRPSERRVVTSRMGLTASSDPPSSSALYRTESGRIFGADGCLTEAAKKQLSRSLSQEFREKKSVEKVVRTTKTDNKTSKVDKTKSSESESAKSDDSVRTVIHVPISTQLLLKKMEKEKEKEKSRIPVYSVYCSKGVPSKVTFFENYYHKPGDSPKQFSTLPTIRSKGSVSTAKIVKTGSSTVGRSVSPSHLRKGESICGERKRGPSVSPVRSPLGTLRRSRSASPSSSTKTALSYMSHVNVISRLASLLLKKDEALKHLVTREIMERDKLERLRLTNAGEVDRLKYYFETFYSNEDEYRKLLPEINLLRCLFCSDPNLARMTEWRSDHCDRRCASADIFKEKLERHQQQQLDRKPDGRESSPVNCSSPDLYLNSRSRKPIYQPSSTPNVCQPTLTAHCFLESPNKSLEYLNQPLVQQPASSSCYSSDYSGNFWDYYSATDSVGTASPSPPYHSVSIPPPPRVLESRGVGSKGTSSGNWNVDPALHQPKFRYVPPQPRTNIHPMPPPLPPPPAPPKISALQQQVGGNISNKSNSENRPCNPYLYRSVRYWRPRTRTRENDGPIPPSRNPPQASQNRIQSPPPPLLPPSCCSSSTAQVASNKNPLVSKQAWSLRHSHDDDDDDDYEEDAGKQAENQIPLVENPFLKQAQLKSNVSTEPESPAASPLLPAAPVKYAESEVNIHYKAPVRLVEKDYIGEEELRRRQQLSMKRFYEEQRHRKFLAEIQDMENRRHTDNFTPSQKSPIPLNRYEDDEPQRPRWRDRTPDQRIVAKALFNFVPQNSRELSFRKGDILYIRRKLDANWLEGEHNAAVGIFPSSYVEVK